MKYWRISAAEPVAPGHAMLVPVNEVVPQLLVLAEIRLQPGVNRSGFWRPSAVGPTPPPHLELAELPFWPLPTATSSP